MSTQEALAEIDMVPDAYLLLDDTVLIADSLAALYFLESFGCAEHDSGDAEVTAIAPNISVDGVARAVFLGDTEGEVRLLCRDQFDDAWDLSRDDRLGVWEATQHLITRLETGDEAAAAELFRQLKQLSGHGDLAANCRALAYRLYNHCEKTKQAEEARAYNGLVIAWPEIEKLAAAGDGSEQSSLF